MYFIVSYIFSYFSFNIFIVWYLLLFLKIDGCNFIFIMYVVNIDFEKFGFYNIIVVVYDLFIGYKYLDSVEVLLFVKVIYIDIR